MDEKSEAGVPTGEESVGGSVVPASPVLADTAAADDDSAFESAEMTEDSVSRTCFPRVTFFVFSVLLVVGPLQTTALLPLPLLDADNKTALHG
jgi:hypothetical protein